jgi:hypothetical protein
MVARVDGKGNAYVTWPTGTANISPSPPAGLALSKSTDGGRTWHFSKALPAPSSYQYCMDNSAGLPAAAIAWGRNHTLYYAAEAFGDGEGGFDVGHVSEFLATTTDLGDHWTSTLVENNRGKTGPNPQDQPSATGVPGMTVDTSGPRDIISVGYSQSYPNAPTNSPLTNPRPMVATSTDGGDTFGTPVNLNDFATNLTKTIDGKPYNIIMRTGFGAPFLTSHNGVILAVAGSDFRSGEAPAPPHSAGQGLTPGTFYAYPNPQLVARSTDQGKTWTVKELGPPIYAGTGSYTGMGWTQKGGANGTFVFTYAATPENSSTTGLADLVVQRSSDGGQTWTEPLAIDDDKPEQHATAFYPQLQVAPNGRVDVVWQDNRDLGDFRFHVRHTYSTDGGLTWAPSVAVTDRPLDFNFGISYNSDIRFPPGVASANEYAFVGWADSRLASDLNQTQDAFGANVQFKALPATSNTTLPIVAAIFGGLVVAGLVLLGVLLVRRRGREPSPAAPRTRAPAGSETTTRASGTQ